MLSIMEDLPQNVVGVKATGKVTKEEFDRVIIPHVDAMAKNRGKINYLLLLETDIGNFEAGAWMKDAVMGLKHLFKWNKVAVVTNQKGVEKFSDAFSYIVPGEYRGYSLDELETAKAWVSAPDLERG